MVVTANKHFCPNLCSIIVLDIKNHTFFLQKAVEQNIGKMEFVVTDWNPAKNFYKRKGAVDYTATEQFHVYQFNKAAIEKMAST